MTPSHLNRRVHKWLALLIGVQALLWLVSGLYMTAVPIEFIHGDHLVRALPRTIPVDAPVRIRLADLRERWPQLQTFALKHWNARIVYEVRHADGTDLVDASSGEIITPLDAETAAAWAAAHYTGRAPVAATDWLERAPAEVGNRPVPLWRVRFADAIDTTFYVSPATGELLTRRHRWWRVFDALWMLHIMDYAERTDVNTPQLRAVASAALLLALSGAWLAIAALRRRRVRA